MSAVEGDVNSGFSAVLTASLEEFFHKALKDEQKECIRRIVSLKEDVLAILPINFKASYNFYSAAFTDGYKIIQKRKNNLLKCKFERNN